VLCKQVDAGLKGYCYQGIGTILGTLKPDTAGRRAACSSVAPARFLDACLRGAGVPVTT
jgi:hypothetical protein